MCKVARLLDDVDRDPIHIANVTVSRLAAIDQN